MKLVELAAASGHFGAVERRLFEILGGWVPSVAEPEVKVFLRVQSFRHAWHAELWSDLTPRSWPAVEAAGVPELSDALDAVGEPSTTRARLVGVYAVLLPQLVDAYRSLVEAAAPASDGPLVRALELMLADAAAAISEAEPLIGRLGGDDSAHRQCMEALLVRNWRRGTARSALEWHEMH